MSGRVVIDTGRLRVCAELLSRVREEFDRRPVDGGETGSAAAVSAVVDFTEYWGPGVAVVLDTVEALASAARSAADAYERRDAQDVWSFQVVSDAI